MSKGLNIDGKVTNEQRNREWKNLKVPFHFSPKLMHSRCSSSQRNTRKVFCSPN